MVADEYYKNYLYGKLDLVFNENGDKTARNFGVESSKTSSNQIDDKRYSTPVETSLEDIRRMFPAINSFMISDRRPYAVKLDNGIVCVKTNKGWFFPQLKLISDCVMDHIRLFDNGYFSIGPFLYNPDKEPIFKSDYSRTGNLGVYELYSDKYFYYKPNSGYEDPYLIDMNGKYVRFQYKYEKPIIKKQCILIKDSDYYNYGKLIPRYKVILTDGTVFLDGNTLSVFDELDDCLILADRLEYSGYFSRNCSSSDLYLILPNGKPLSSEMTYNSFKKINNKLIIAEKNSLYSIYNMEGKKITKESFRKVTPYGIHNQMICKGLDNKEYVLDEEGNFFSNKGYDLITLINQDYAQVRDNGEYFIVDKNGKKIHSNGKKVYEPLYLYNNIIVAGENKLIVVPDDRLEKANVQKNFFGYTYNNGHETIHVKYQPVMLYGDYQALCVSNKKEFYLYNIMTKEYTKVGYISTIHYNESFIESHGNVLFPYNEKLLDITDYYNEKLSKKETIRFNSKVGEIQTKEEYVKENKGDLALLQVQQDLENEKKAEEHREAEKRMREKKAKEEAARKALLAKQEQERIVRETAERKRKEEEENKALKNDYLAQMKELHKKLKELDQYIEIPRIPVNDLLIDCGDHKEINPAYVDYLDIVDLSHETFENVKMSGGLNFEGSNIRFDPQVVYNKNLSGSNFTGIYFSPFTDFTDVNIIGSTFSFDNDSSTIDMFNSSIASSYYDDTTTINGKSVDEYLKRETFNKQQNGKTKHLEIKHSNN